MTIEISLHFNMSTDPLDHIYSFLISTVDCILERRFLSRGGDGVGQTKSNRLLVSYGRKNHNPFTVCNINATKMYLDHFVLNLRA